MKNTLRKSRKQRSEGSYRAGHRRELEKLLNQVLAERALLESIADAKGSRFPCRKIIE